MATLKIVGYKCDSCNRSQDQVPDNVINVVSVAPRNPGQGHGGKSKALVTRDLCNDCTVPVINAMHRTRSPRGRKPQLAANVIFLKDHTKSG